MAEFNKLGYDVVGASTDDIQTLKKFQASCDAGQRFISDPGGSIAKAFGVDRHADSVTYAGRVTFVVGTDGKILYKLDDPVPQSNVATTLDWVKAHPAKSGG